MPLPIATVADDILDLGFWKKDFDALDGEDTLILDYSGLSSGHQALQVRIDFTSYDG